MDERPESAGPDHFIAQRIRKDQAQGKHGGAVVTRFPPEPNGYLHLGHAKSICLNFGMAEVFGGRCNLRLDDTNPAKESSHYAEAIERDVTWLGFSFGAGPLHASDYFERIYECAEALIEKGLAYVDSQDQEAIRAQRGTLTEPGTESPFRGRGVEENLALFRAMRAGDFEDGAHVLRAKIDMGSPNLNLRDPVLYRIRRMAHQRTGDGWCIYPMYDYTHCLSDAFEGITHSLCTLEFEDHRPLYDWVLDQFSWEVRPQQIEFSRLELEYTVLSKRHLNALVTEGHVEGWDDPRMPTLAGLRRRGVPPAALKDFCERIGITKSDGTVEMALLERCIREALESAPRALAVLKPLPVELLNYPEDGEEWFEAPLHPKDPEGASRRIPFGRHLFIESDDFEEVPPKKYKRLSPGAEVRLRHGYVIRCERFDADEAGRPTKLYCTVDLESRAGGANAEKKVKGVIHWVSAAHALDAEVHLYDRLFTDPDPSGIKSEGGFRDVLNPDSLVGCAAKLEPALGALAPGEVVQFERLGYFCPDEDSTDTARRFNRTITLRDTWGASEFGPGALSHLKVLELGQLIAGPFCGQLLGDMGADVIKIEAPGVGDPMRSWGQGKPVWWSVIGRNKRSVTLDLRKPAGREVLKTLAADADILIENFRPGTLEKWELSPEALRALNPRLIIVRVSGFGQTGPYAQRAGYGSIGEAMGGMRYLAGDPDRPPSRVGLSIGDALAATFACLGALTALEHRNQTGQGQVVDSAIYEAVLAMMESTVPEYTEAGVIRERTGAILPKIAPSNVYPTASGEMVLIGANQDSVFARLAEAMGTPALATDARYASHTARGEHQEELDLRIAEWTSGFSAEALLALCEDHGVPAGRIYRVPDMLADPQYQARESIVPVADPTYPGLKMQNVFPRLSETPGQIRWPGPALGAHTEAVLEAHGFDAEAREALRQDGVI